MQWQRLAPLMAVLVSGCVVFLPETSTVYNAECRTYERHATLSATQSAPLLSCRGEGCVAALVFSGVVSVASVVISGTIVLKDNIASWLERPANCVPENR